MAAAMLLCFSDAVAVGVLQTASELDLSVPRDLSVVGFDDSSLAGRVRPALTTYDRTFRRRVGPLRPR